MSRKIAVVKNVAKNVVKIAGVGRKTMNVTISNFKGIKDAQFSLNPSVTLVAGDNGAGKSSLAQAMAAALTGEPPLAGLKKADYQRLVRSGAATASIEIETYNHDGNDISVITYPDGKSYRKGNAPQASPYAAGVISPLDLASKEAAAFWATTLKTEPTIKDLEKALLEVVSSSEMGSKVVTAVKTQGWDGAYNKYKDEGARTKGRWEQITGERYGTNKAEGWTPKTTTYVNIIDELKVKVAEHEKQHELALNEEGELREALAKLPAGILSCPKCGQNVFMTAGVLTLANIDKDTTEQERQRLTASLKLASNKSKETQDKLLQVQLEVSKAESANSAMADAEVTARQLHKDILELAEIVKLLASDGLRKRHLNEAITGFNSTLSSLSEAARWGLVAIEADLAVSYAGRPFVVLSESEQYRVRSTIQAAIAVLDESDCLIFDRADLLTKKGRNGLVQLCRAVGKPCVVLMSANQVEEMPEGTLWLENGQIRSKADE